MHQLIHLLEHISGIDNANGHWYLLWSGIVGTLLPIGLGILGYFRLKVHHKRHIQALQNQIAQFGNK